MGFIVELPIVKEFFFIMVVAASLFSKKYHVC